MPYYCTVPKCNSMAGKIRNVSFHQFPKDEDLAHLWNTILKRGKPYTKYSKVCSLHFKPEDYTMTSIGKNKGQWRTLRKDAVPSQNLPSDPPTTVQCSPSEPSLTEQGTVPIINQQIQQQIAQAIYMHTMLAMQSSDLNKTADNCADNPARVLDNDVLPAIPVQKHNIDIREAEMTKNFSILENILSKPVKIPTIDNNDQTKFKENNSYKCEECLKCFKDPDVFVLHKRNHTQKDSDEENLSKNGDSIQKNKNDVTQNSMLRANPILANLLNSNRATPQLDDNSKNVQSLALAVNRNLFLASDVLKMENQVMAAMALNMEAYLKNLSDLWAAKKNAKNDVEDYANPNFNIQNDSSPTSTSDNGYVNGSESNESTS